LSTRARNREVAGFFIVHKSGPAPPMRFVLFEKAISIHKAQIVYLCTLDDGDQKDEKRRKVFPFIFAKECRMNQVERCPWCSSEFPAPSSKKSKPESERRNNAKHTHKRLRSGSP
jgi:hypothetical protein